MKIDYQEHSTLLIFFWLLKSSYEKSQKEGTKEVVMTYSSFQKSLFSVGMDILPIKSWNEYKVANKDYIDLEKPQILINKNTFKKIEIGKEELKIKLGENELFDFCAVLEKLLDAFISNSINYESTFQNPYVQVRQIEKVMMQIKVTMLKYEIGKDLLVTFDKITKFKGVNSISSLFYLDVTGVIKIKEFSLYKETYRYQVKIDIYEEKFEKLYKGITTKNLYHTLEPLYDEIHKKESKQNTKVSSKNDTNLDQVGVYFDLSFNFNEGFIWKTGFNDKKWKLKKNSGELFTSASRLKELLKNQGIALFAQSDWKNIVTAIIQNTAFTIEEFEKYKIIDKGKYGLKIKK